MYNISTATLVAYLPPAARAVGTAVIVAPGGAFHTIGVNNEAADVAKWLNSKGIAVFVLRYRLVHCETDDPFKEIGVRIADKAKFEITVDSVVNLAIADGIKAVEYVRNHANDYNISPTRIGMMGFSAGGTITLGTTLNAPKESRPDFIAPIYFYSNIRALKKINVPADAPPAFFCAASDDDLGLATPSSNLYSAWMEIQKQSEVHIYEKGNHGFGLRKQNLPVDTWTDRFEEWLDIHGWLWPHKPTGFYAAFTPTQAKQMRQAEADRLKTDWAYLGRYAQENKNLPAPKPNEKRVVFIGSSRVENWKKFDSTFFKNNAYLNRGVSGQTSPQMLLRFREDVLIITI